MTMFNADGSESGMCGNGIRCLVSFAMDNGIVSPDKSRVVVETSSRDLEVTPIFQDGTMARAVVAMGERGSWPRRSRSSLRARTWLWTTH